MTVKPAAPTSPPIHLLKLLAAAVLALAPFALIAVFNTRLYTVLDIAAYLTFHNLVEFFSVMVSLSIFGVGWYTFDQSQNRHTLFLGAAFLAIGLVDFMHTLSFPGMPDFITANSTNKTVLFWIAGRLFAAAAFLASAFIQPDSDGRWLSKSFLLPAAAAFTLLAFGGVAFFPQALPPMFVEGVGLTPAKLLAEYAAIALLALAAAAYNRRYRKTGNPVHRLYLAAFILCIFSELAFTLYKSAFDSYNMIGHLYKLAAFLLIYQGIFIASVKAPYVELVQTRDRLKATVAEQARTAGELRQKTEELDRFFAVNPDLLAIANIHGYFVRLNPAWEQTLGFSPQELTAKSFMEFIHPEDVDRTRKAVAELAAQQHVIDFVNRYRCKDGSYRWIEWRAAPSGELVYAAARDITERKHIEQTLVENEKLVGIGTLAAGIAHEINSPLQVITGLTESSQRLLAREPITAEELQRRFGLIGKNAWRIAKIVRSLLDYARTGPAESLYPCSLNDMVGQALVLTEHQFRSWANITIETDLAPDLPLTLLDANLVTQVMINLMTNARDAMPAGGTISIQTFFDSAQGDVVLRVADTGSGIPESIREKIFAPFFTTKGPGSGTGLGLSIVCDIVRSFNGKIELEETSPAGSTFRVSFPVIAPSAVEVDIPAA